MKSQGGMSYIHKNLCAHSIFNEGYGLCITAEYKFQG